MNEHIFTLILDRDPDEFLDELFEAGCDDALFGEVDGTHYAEFTREAPTLAAAVASAITNVHSVGEVRVLRVEPDDIVTVSEIADRLGRTRESVRLLVGGQRGSADFPMPFSHSRERNRLWRWTDVLAWADSHGLVQSVDLASARTVAAVNAALELDMRLTQLGPERDVTILSAVMPASYRDLIASSTQRERASQ
jgi:hypothetical protein